MLGFQKYLLIHNQNDFDQEKAYNLHTTFANLSKNDVLNHKLKNGKNDEVSNNASHNPNCPIEERIKWMMKAGKIIKEDPSKHIIEYETIKEDDFQDLKDLL